MENEKTPIELLLNEISKRAENILSQNEFRPHPEQAWWFKSPDKWITEIMQGPFRAAALGVMDYRELRVGLIETCAALTIAIRRADELNKPAPTLDPDINNS